MIKEFDMNNKPIKEIIEYISGLWNHGYGVWKIYKYGKEIKLEIHTGGWSTNEELIEEFESIKYLGMFWRKSERGGHYYYSFPEFVYNNPLTKNPQNMEE